MESDDTTNLGQFQGQRIWVEYKELYDYQDAVTFYAVGRYFAMDMARVTVPDNLPHCVKAEDGERSGIFSNDTSDATGRIVKASHKGNLAKAAVGGKTYEITIHDSNNQLVQMSIKSRDLYIYATELLKSNATVKLSYNALRSGLNPDAYFNYTSKLIFGIERLDAGLQPLTTFDGCPTSFDAVTYSPDQSEARAQEAIEVESGPAAQSGKPNPPRQEEDQGGGGLNIPIY